ncbi:MAG: ABC-2 family transporter protein [Anaeromyxobacteraceae bacterium]
MRLSMLLEYRLGLLVGAAGMIVIHAASIAGLWVVLRPVGTLAGWRFEELLLCYGLLTTARAIEHTLADNLWVIGAHMREGTFDRFLVRPIDPLFYFLADRFNVDGLGTAAVGLAATTWAWAALGIPASPMNLAVALVAILSGGVVFIAINLITATTAFWIVESVPITRAVHELHDFARFPLTLYGRKLELLFTWILPFGLASFWPASHLTGRDVGGIVWAAPFVATALALLAYRFWRFGLAHHEGTGT